MPKPKQKSNLLKSESLILGLETNLKKRTAKLKTPPNLALVWVGNDKQTGKFVKAKKNKAAQLGVGFSLHHFEKIEERQLLALIGTLNANKKVDGIIVQLPLPKNIKEGNVLSSIEKEKDVDNLNASDFPPPTPTGIIELIKHNKIDLSTSKTVIIGAGKLVGAPLAKIFEDNSWKYSQIVSSADRHIEQIRSADVVISATGVKNLIKPEMVTEKSVVVDGSGLDADTKEIAPYVNLITPKTGAVGPLTVLILMQNVISSAEHRQDS